IIDFTGVNNAVVFMGGVAAYGSVGGTEGGAMFMNGGSAVAHVMSESNYLAGKRVHHIMLSEFPIEPQTVWFSTCRRNLSTRLKCSEHLRQYKKMQQQILIKQQQ